MAITLEVNAVVEVMEDKGYRVFKNKRGHDLNLVGIRTDDNTANSFNDHLTVFYRFDKRWNFFAFPATTDPGTFYRKNPIMLEGTAILKPGQYRGAYKVGKHKGYPALQQNGRLTVYRDNNKNAVLDTSGSIEETGFYSINIHRANRIRASVQVDKWSAGCQVLQDPDHFDFLMALCRKSRDKFSNSFTYTLLEESDFN